jgi:RNA polymerase sigma factor (sigma-70 family)
VPTNLVLLELGAHRAEVADLDVARMMRRAADGDPSAWEGLVDKYGRLIWSITRDFKLVETDAADVFQITWMKLLEHVNRIDHPDRVGSWLATTARNECLRCLTARKRLVVADEDVILDHLAEHGADIDEGLLAQERAESVRAAMELLPWRWRRLMELLMSDPPVSYAEISDELGLPIGSIGPTRARCLARLRTLLEAS